MSKHVELKSREKFVGQVAFTILKNHAKCEESFIFGISGKWGEGKTTFLDSLESNLIKKDKTIRVVRLNPWKFASDKLSFLRHFVTKIRAVVKRRRPFKFSEFNHYCLTTIKTNIKTGHLFAIEKNFRNYIRDIFPTKNTIDISKLYYDESRHKIHKLHLTFVILIILSLFILWSCIPLSNIGNISQNLKWLLTVITIPVIIALIGKIISVQQSSRAVSTLDKFDEYLNDILVGLHNNKIVVFVDDLDRVTPTTARTVLDNLRTFFDKKIISFVVTGDHTILERYLGDELLPLAKEPEQIEEGRRFLKKIFDVYWRLPIPLQSELDGFLSSEFSKRSGILNKIFNDDELIIFQKYLAKYFDRNFRHILRFIETVIFTFGFIEDQCTNMEDDYYEHLHELSDNPLLVVRSLMIQELCNPLFEEILKKHEILSRLEDAVQKKQTDKIQAIVQEYSEKLSPLQIRFAESFLYEEPRFNNRFGPRVRDIRTFLHFTADASFGDLRGPSPADFTEILKSDDPQKVRDSLLLSGKQKTEEAAKASVKCILETEEDTAKGSTMKTLLIVLVDIPVEYFTHRFFMAGLMEVDFSFVDNLPLEDQQELYITLLKWLDLIYNKFESEIENYFNKFPFIINIIKDVEIDKVGVFTTKLVVQQLVQYYNDHKSDALVKMRELLPKLDRIVILDSLSEVTTFLINDIITQPDITVKNNAFELLADYTENGIANLSGRIMQGVGDLNKNLWDWAITKVDAEKCPWDKGQLENQIISQLKSELDDQNFITILQFAIGKIDQKIDDFWRIIFDKQRSLFYNNMISILKNITYKDLAPNHDTAKEIFENIFEDQYPYDGSIAEKGNLLSLFHKSIWMWKNLSKMPFGRHFAGIQKAKDDQLKHYVQQVIDSWA